MHILVIKPKDLRALVHPRLIVQPSSKGMMQAWWGYIVQVINRQLHTIVGYGVVGVIKIEEYSELH